MPLFQSVFKHQNRPECGVVQDKHTVIQLNGAGIKLCQIQHGSDQHFQPLDFLRHNREIFHAFVLGNSAVQNALYEPADNGHRGTQFVRNVGHKLAAGFFCPSGLTADLCTECGDQFQIGTGILLHRNGLAVVALCITLQCSFQLFQLRIASPYLIKDQNARNQQQCKRQDRHKQKEMCGIQIQRLGV